MSPAFLPLAEPPALDGCISCRRAIGSFRKEAGLEGERSVAKRAQGGDPEAFEALVRAHEEVAFRVAYLIVRDEADAQDVAQEAFVRAYGSLGRFDASQPFRPWLLRIVTNLALNNRRSFRRRREMQERYQKDAAMVDSQSPAASAERQEKARTVWDALGHLEPRDQTLLYLRYFLGASEAETATAIGRPVGTVKSRLHRALWRLRQTIEEQYPELLPEAKGATGGRVPS